MTRSPWIMMLYHGQNSLQKRPLIGFHLILWSCIIILSQGVKHKCLHPNFFNPLVSHCYSNYTLKITIFVTPFNTLLSNVTYGWPQSSMESNLKLTGWQYQIEIFFDSSLIPGHVCQEGIWKNINIWRISEF